MTVIFKPHILSHPPDFVQNAFLGIFISLLPTFSAKRSLLSSLLAIQLTTLVVFNHQLFTKQLGIALGEFMNNTLNSTGNNEYTSAINKLGEMDINKLEEMAMSKIENIAEISADELSDSGYFQFNSGSYLTPDHMAELITAAFRATRMRTRYREYNYFTVHNQFVGGVINDTKFFAYESGYHRNVVIKGYRENDEKEIWVAMAYEDIDEKVSKRVILPGQMQDEAEKIFANLHD